MSSPPEEPRHRLDPERAAALSESSRTPKPPPPVIDTRRYRWAIGIFGVLLLVGVAVYTLAKNGIGTAGIPPGQRLHLFAAPLANTTLNGDPNLNPPCTLARHDPRALNICLLVGRAPLVLGFFVTGSDACKQQVDTMQAVSREFSPSRVTFAAVAVDAGHSETAKLVRSRGWTIPVAYDRDGSLGTLYGVEICPMLELAYRGGIVKYRLIGNHWLTASALAAKVRALVAG